MLCMWHCAVFVFSDFSGSDTVSMLAHGKMQTHMLNMHYIHPLMTGGVVSGSTAVKQTGTLHEASADMALAGNYSSTY